MAGSLHELGLSQRELGNPDCIQSFRQCIAISQWVGDSYHEKQSTFAIGVAYFDIDQIRDLQQAEYWFNCYSDLLEEHETLERSFLLNEVGNLARTRAYQVERDGGSLARIESYLQEAVDAYHQALELTPSHAPESLALKHNSLGSAYRELGAIETSLEHSREAIRLAELAGDLYRAGTARTEAAKALLADGRYEDARLYAQAALNDFGTFGQGAAAETSNTYELLSQIELAADDTN